MRRAGLQAAGAVAAPVGLWHVVGIDFCVDKDFAKKEARAGVGEDELRILSYPAKTGTPSPITLEYGCRVTECTALLYGGGRVADDELLQGGKLGFHEVMIVFAVSVPCQLAGVGRKKLRRIVVEGDTDDAACAFHQQTWVEALVGVIIHVVHVGLVVASQPAVQGSGGRLVYSIGWGNAASIKAEAQSFGFDGEREVGGCRKLFRGRL